MSRLIFAESAAANLRDIRLFVERDSGNKEIAQKLIGKILQRCRVYAQHPNLGRISDDYGPGNRRFPCGKYVIFYKSITDGIAILHVWHGAQNLPDLIHTPQQK